MMKRITNRNTYFDFYGAEILSSFQRRDCQPVYTFLI